LTCPRILPTIPRKESDVRKDDVRALSPHLTNGISADSRGGSEEKDCCAQQELKKGCYTKNLP
jgi:hypothetical protein